MEKLRTNTFKIIAFVLLCILMCFAGDGQAQNVVKDQNGNYKAITTSRNDSSKTILTTFTYTDSKGEVYKVYETLKGKRFVNKISKKTGNGYKMYLKEN